MRTQTGEHQARQYLGAAPSSGDQPATHRKHIVLLPLAVGASLLAASVVLHFLGMVCG